MFLVYGGQRRRSVLRWAACFSAAGLVAVAGCASGGSRPAAAPPSPSASPQQALLAAAVRAQQVTSAAETVTMRFSGAHSGSATATAQFRLKPSLEASEDLSLTQAGKTMRLKMILTRTALYMTAPVFASLSGGKPWVKVSMSDMKGAASFAQLWQGMESDNFANQDQMLAVAKNAKVVGHETVAGVPTTEYAGSVTVAEAIKELPASFRKTMSPQWQDMGGNTVIHFRVWLDDQHQTRRLAEVETFSGVTLDTTATVTAINGPVDIVLPPASRTMTEP
jgi:hypothetical protein